MQPVLLATPGLLGYAIRTTDVTVPLRKWYDVDSGSPLIKQGDPVKLLAAGTVTRATITDTAILGFAETLTAQPLPTTIANLGAPISSLNGLKQIAVDIATPNLQITGRVLGTTALSELGQCDLAYISAGITPTVTSTGSSTGHTWSYKVSAVTNVGESTVTTAGSVTISAATLNSTTYNTVTIVQPASKNLMIGYNVYVDLDGGGYVFVGYVPVDPNNANVVLIDTGQARTAQVPSTTNYSGFVVNTGATSTNAVQIVGLDPRDPVGAQNGRVEFIIPYAISQWGGANGSV